MTKDEFEEKLVAVMGEALQAGFLHGAVFLANTSEHHMMLTNMGERTTLRFMLHMGEHALDRHHSEMSVWNFATGEKVSGVEADEIFKTGTRKGNGRRKKAH